jgi:hypothetical protein
MNAGRPGGTIAKPRARRDAHWMKDELDERLAQARGGERPIALAELESLYTSGCAEVLELEADAVRTQRRIAELRAQLRHVRTAIEWLQEQEAATASDASAL